jgi:hypothetical protein
VTTTIEWIFNSNHRWLINHNFIVYNAV